MASRCQAAAAPMQSRLVGSVLDEARRKAIPPATLPPNGPVQRQQEYAHQFMVAIRRRLFEQTFKHNPDITGKLPGKHEFDLHFTRPRPRVFFPFFDQPEQRFEASLMLTDVIQEGSVP